MLILQWDGVARSKVESSSPSVILDELSSIGPVSATGAWAVGMHLGGSGVGPALYHTLILHGRACVLWLTRDPDAALAALAPHWPGPRPVGRPAANTQTGGARRRLDRIEETTRGIT